MSNLFDISKISDVEILHAGAGHVHADKDTVLLTFMDGKRKIVSLNFNRVQWEQIRLVVEAHFKSHTRFHDQEK